MNHIPSNKQVPSAFSFWDQKRKERELNTELETIPRESVLFSVKTLILKACQHQDLDYKLHIEPMGTLETATLSREQTQVFRKLFEPTGRKLLKDGLITPQDIDYLFTRDYFNASAETAQRLEKILKDEKRINLFSQIKPHLADCVTLFNPDIEKMTLSQLQKLTTPGGLVCIKHRPFLRDIVKLSPEALDYLHSQDDKLGRLFIPSTFSEFIQDPWNLLTRLSCQEKPVEQWKLASALNLLISSFLDDTSKYKGLRFATKCWSELLTPIYVKDVLLEAIPKTSALFWEKARLFKAYKQGVDYTLHIAPLIELRRIKYSEEQLNILKELFEPCGIALLKEGIFTGTEVNHLFNSRTAHTDFSPETVGDLRQILDEPLRVEHFKKMRPHLSGPITLLHYSIKNLTTEQLGRIATPAGLRAVDYGLRLRSISDIPQQNLDRLHDRTISLDRQNFEWFSQEEFRALFAKDCNIESLFALKKEKQLNSVPKDSL